MTTLATALDHLADTWEGLLAGPENVTGALSFGEADALAAVLDHAGHMRTAARLRYAWALGDPERFEYVTPDCLTAMLALIEDEIDPAAIGLTGKGEPA